MDPLANEAVVRIAETGTSRGLGVHAKTDIPTGYRVIFERPVLSCAAATLTDASLYYEWTKLGVQGQNRLKVLFWKLRLLSSSEDPGFYTMRRLKSFVREHAYLQLSDPKRANIYKWCSYLNHACRACANAEYVVDADTGAISVTTTKPLAAGEEVIVNYNRGKGNLHCTGCTPSSTVVGTWYLLRYRFFRWSARMAWSGVEDPTLFPPDYPLLALSARERPSPATRQLDESRSDSTILPESPRESRRVFSRLRGVCRSILAYFQKKRLPAGQDEKEIELESEIETAGHGKKAQ